MVLFLLVSKFIMSVMRRSEVLWRVSHNTTICGSQIICRQDGIFVWLSFTEEMHEFSLLWTNVVITTFFFRTHTSKHGDWNYIETLSRCRRRTAEHFWILFFCLEVRVSLKGERVQVPLDEAPLVQRVARTCFNLGSEWCHGGSCFLWGWYEPKNKGKKCSFGYFFY